jgi:hypothetical protein
MLYMHALLLLPLVLQLPLPLPPHYYPLSSPAPLQETYGKGYQINLVTEQSYVPEVEAVLRSALPGSRFVGDQRLTGYVSVSVSRRDVANLPRFFAWLEAAPGAVANIREWGISNTTLEQVCAVL